MFGASFNLLDFIFGLVALIVAITIHEYSHAWAAEHLGDPTPRLQGRLTLNPLAHLDPIGTILLILVHFGWGKPVQFDPFNLRNPRRDSALISIAGPISNMILAIICSLILQLLLHVQIASLHSAGFSTAVLLFGGLLQQIIVMNVMLGIFNLVPIHPLDGFKIVEGILPEQQAHEWHELERFGVIFLVFLLFPIFGGTAPIVRIISPVINGILTILLPSSPLL
jgi:Zn-dependent protease